MSLKFTYIIIGYIAIFHYIAWWNIKNTTLDKELKAKEKKKKESYSLGMIHSIGQQIDFFFIPVEWTIPPSLSMYFLTLPLYNSFTKKQISNLILNINTSQIKYPKRLKTQKLCVFYHKSFHCLDTNPIFKKKVIRSNNAYEFGSINEAHEYLQHQGILMCSQLMRRNKKFFIFSLDLSLKLSYKVWWVLI